MYEEWKDQCRVQISRDDFTIISEQIRVFITFFRREIGENRGEGILNLGWDCAWDLSYVGIMSSIWGSCNEISDLI